MSRDFQRQKVYNAEHQLQWFLDNVEHGTVCLHGVPLQLEPEARYGDLGAIQAYCDRVLAMPSVRAYAGTPDGYQPRLKVRERKTGHAAHYQGGVIAVHTKGSRWAMRETVILHEIAHYFTGGDGHGPIFTKVHCDLLELVMGPQIATAMQICYQAGEVKIA